MRPRVVYVTIFLLSVHLSISITVKLQPSEIHSSEKHQLPPLTIRCKLNDILIISAPVLVDGNPRYQLFKPNGDFKELNISKLNNGEDRDHYNIKTYYNKSIALPQDKYKIYNPKNVIVRIFEAILSDIEEDSKDFVIGPLSEEDHGNWVLSIYEREDERWTEYFQVISINIIEYILPKLRMVHLNIGDNFTFGFAYPITELETCEFTAPRSYDRWYTRVANELNSCVFLVKNITKEDEGTWKIFGVGRIHFVALVGLHVNCTLTTSS